MFTEHIVCLHMLHSRNIAEPSRKVNRVNRIGNKVETNSGNPLRSAGISSCGGIRL